MMEDAVYLLLAGGLIALAILAYTRSIFLTLTTLTSILYTLSLAYFFYTFVFGVAFFPFMNVLATVIAIGKFPEVRHIFFNSNDIVRIILIFSTSIFNFNLHYVQGLELNIIN